MGGKIMTKFVGLRAKVYNFLIDDCKEDKKEKGTNKFIIKIEKKKINKNLTLRLRLKIENYKKCLESTQLDNKINYLEKNKITVDSLKKPHKEFIKNNKYI